MPVPVEDQQVRHMDKMVLLVTVIQVRRIMVLVEVVEVMITQVLVVEGKDLMAY